MFRQKSPIIEYVPLSYAAHIFISPTQGKYVCWSHSIDDDHREGKTSSSVCRWCRRPLCYLGVIHSSITTNGNCGWKSKCTILVLEKWHCNDCRNILKWLLLFVCFPLISLSPTLFEDIPKQPLIHVLLFEQCLCAEKPVKIDEPERKKSVCTGEGHRKVWMRVGTKKSALGMEHALWHPLTQTHCWGSAGWGCCGHEELHAGVLCSELSASARGSGVGNCGIRNMEEASYNFVFVFCGGFCPVINKREPLFLSLFQNLSIKLYCNTSAMKIEYYSVLPKSCFWKDFLGSISSP